MKDHATLRAELEDLVSQFEVQEQKVSNAHEQYVIVREQLKSSRSSKEIAREKERCNRAYLAEQEKLELLGLQVLIAEDEFKQLAMETRNGTDSEQE